MEGITSQIGTVTRQKHRGPSGFNRLADPRNLVTGQIVCDYDREKAPPEMHSGGYNGIFPCHEAAGVIFLSRRAAESTRQ